MAKHVPFPVSLYNGPNKINDQMELMIQNCSSYLKHQMPEKNKQLIAHIFHLSQCTGIAERTIGKICRHKKDKDPRHQYLESNHLWSLTHQLPKSQNMMEDLKKLTNSLKMPLKEKHMRITKKIQ